MQIIRCCTGVFFLLIISSQISGQAAGQSADNYDMMQAEKGFTFTNNRDSYAVIQGLVGVMVGSGRQALNESVHEVGNVKIYWKKVFKKLAAASKPAGAPRKFLVAINLRTRAIGYLSGVLIVKLQDEEAIGRLEAKYAMVLTRYYKRKKLALFSLEEEANVQQVYERLLQEKEAVGRVELDVVTRVNKRF